MVRDPPGAIPSRDIRRAYELDGSGVGIRPLRPTPARRPAVGREKTRQRRSVRPRLDAGKPISCWPNIEPTAFSLDPKTSEADQGAAGAGPVAMELLKLPVLHQHHKRERKARNYNRPGICRYALWPGSSFDEQIPDMPADQFRGFGAQRTLNCRWAAATHCRHTQVAGVVRDRKKPCQPHHLTRRGPTRAPGQAPGPFYCQIRVLSG